MSRLYITPIAADGCSNLINLYFDVDRSFKSLWLSVSEIEEALQAQAIKEKKKGKE